MDSSFLGSLILVAVLVSIVCVFRGPAKSSQRHIAALEQQLQDAADITLFRSVYSTKSTKNAVLAWVLTVFLSPTVAYLYQGKWALAVLSFITLQGLGLWWLIALFSMPSEVARNNRRLADEAYNQVMLSRPGMHMMPANVAVR